MDTGDYHISIEIKVKRCESWLRRWLLYIGCFADHEGNVGIFYTWFLEEKAYFSGIIIVVVIVIVVVIIIIIITTIIIITIINIIY